MKSLVSPKVRLVLTTIILLALFSLLFAKIDAKGVVAAIKKGDLRLVLLAVAISLANNILLGAVKWGRILSDLGHPLSYREVLAIRSGCIPFKLIFPMKSSEVLKAFYLNRQKRLSFGRAASSILLDKTLNLLVTLCIFLLALSLIDLEFPKILPLAGLLLTLLFLFSTAARTILLSFAKNIHIKLHDFSAQLLSSFAEIGLKEKAVLSFYSVIYQLSELVNTYILFKAVGVNVPFSMICVLVPLIMAVNNLPVTVLGLGTREASMVFLFAQYGPAAYLLGAAMLVSFVEQILPVIIGLFFVKSFLTYFAIKDAEIPRVGVRSGHSRKE